MSPTTLLRRSWTAALVVLLGLVAVGRLAATELAEAAVVVVVDTSVSMRDEGMDPQRASLLVAKLLTDIVPGALAVVRLLDLVEDGDVLPSRETDQSGPCPEDASRTCPFVEAATNWEVDAREKQLGMLIRPSHGDMTFKQELETHLEQRINNSLFHLAFRSAQGFLDRHAQGDRPRAVIWLSDGRTDNEEVTQRAIAELRRDGVAVEAIVFGQGDPGLARDAGLPVTRVATPAQLMRAFAGAFRRLVQAPFEIDNTVAGEPSFEMKPNVDEAWVVVYGDDTLSGAALDGPVGTKEAADAADRWPGAGAYRVAYLRRPVAGRYAVRAAGGGTGVAYAVVQRSALLPVLLAPAEAIAGVPVELVAGVRAGLDGELLVDPEVLAGATLTARFQDADYPFVDDGTQGDATAGDGRYTGRAAFQGMGEVPVEVHLLSPIVDRKATATVQVNGVFRVTGGPVVVDLGSLKAGGESCRPLAVPAERLGTAALALRLLRNLPGGHALTLQRSAGRLEPGGAAQPVAADEELAVCLEIARSAGDSQAAGEPWLELGLAGSDDPAHRLAIQLRWTVHRLGFWERWGRIVLALLAALVIAFVIGGYVWPQRFQRALAVAFVPSSDELDEQTPQPVAQWRGVGIGFYRHARAFLHSDFRLSGKAQGAVASLHAEKGATRVNAGRGGTLYRETLDSDWEAVSNDGRRVRPGDVYRVGQQGPYFRISLERWKR